MESRHLQDDERIDQLEEQLKTAKFMAEDADRKYDEVGRLEGMQKIRITILLSILIFHLTIAIMEHVKHETNFYHYFI